VREPYVFPNAGLNACRSSVQVQTLDPVWNEVWKLKNVPSHATLFVKVLDKDDGTITDDYIGKFDTTVSAGAKEIEIAGPLFHRTRGSFWLKVRNAYVPRESCFLIPSFRSIARRARTQTPLPALISLTDRSAIRGIIRQRSGVSRI
jgi:hypothetical protein